MSTIITVIAAIFALLSGTTTATEPSTPVAVEQSTDANVGPIMLPDVAENPDFKQADVFQVTDNGDLVLIGHGGIIAPGLAHVVTENTSMPRGYYVLRHDNFLVGIEATEATTATP